MIGSLMPLATACASIADREWLLLDRSPTRLDRHVSPRGRTSSLCFRRLWALLSGTHLCLASHSISFQAFPELQLTTESLRNGSR